MLHAFARDLWEHSNLLFDTYDWETAADFFVLLSSMLSEPRLHQRCLVNEGLIRARLGDYNLAKECFLTAVSQDYASIIAWCAMAEMYFMEGEPGIAQHYYELCLASRLDQFTFDEQLAFGWYPTHQQLQDNIDILRYNKQRNRGIWRIPADYLFRPFQDPDATTESSPLTDLPSIAEQPRGRAVRSDQIAVTPHLRLDNERPRDRAVRDDPGATTPHPRFDNEHARGRAMRDDQSAETPHLGIDNEQSRGRAMKKDQTAATSYLRLDNGHARSKAGTVRNDQSAATPYLRLDKDLPPLPPLSSQLSSSDRSAAAKLVGFGGMPSSGLKTHVKSSVPPTRNLSLSRLLPSKTAHDPQVPTAKYRQRSDTVATLPEELHIRLPDQVRSSQKKLQAREAKVKGESIQELAAFVKHAGPGDGKHVTVEHEYINQLLKAASKGDKTARSSLTSIEVESMVSELDKLGPGKEPERASATSTAIFRM